MGAYGAALTARMHYLPRTEPGPASVALGLIERDELDAFSVEVERAPASCARTTAS
jgi:hypothetical protein